MVEVVDHPTYEATSGDEEDVEVVIFAHSVYV
jgi:hypothetical protein